MQRCGVPTSQHKRALTDWWRSGDYAMGSMPCEKLGAKSVNNVSARLFASSGRTRLRVVISLCLPLYCVGCVNTPEPVQTRTIYLLPPAEWLQGQAVPPLRGDTWADIAAWAAQSAETALACEADKAALRRWAREQQSDE